MMDRSDIDDALRRARDSIARQFPEGGEARAYIATHWHRYRYDLGRIVPRLPAGAAVLDLGAAPFCVPEALARLGYDVVGAGLWPEPVGLALAFKAVRVDCDREKLPFPDDRFDAVVFTEVFEHLYVDPLGAVEEIRRVLRPGGFLYLTTPNAIGVRRLCRLALRGALADDVATVLRDIQAGGVIGHFREYTPREIARVLEAAGFAAVEMATVSPYRKGTVEGWLWRAAAAPFPRGREVIAAIAIK